MNPTSSIDVIEHIYDQRHSFDVIQQQLQQHSAFALIGSSFYDSNENEVRQNNNNNDQKQQQQQQQQQHEFISAAAAAAPKSNHTHQVNNQDTPLRQRHGEKNDNDDDDDNHNNNNLNINDDHQVSLASFWYEESPLIIHLALPTVIILLGATIPGFLTASYIGLNYGSTYLDGYMLANLTGNLCTLTLLQGIFSASDTLSPAAYGAQNYVELGYIAIRAIISSNVIIIPIIAFLCIYMDTILIYVGEDEIASKYATSWYRIYAIQLPVLALFQVMWKFLSAQHIMAPLVIVVIVSSGIILPILLNLLGNQNVLGYEGTAIAFVLYQVFQCVTLLLYLYYKRPYHQKTWTGIHNVSMKQVFTWKNKFSTFISLAAGGMLASSEWIYWETLSLIIGTIGVIELSVHTIPSQTIMVMFMIPLGIGIALAVRIGNLLPVSAARAKYVSWYGFCFSTGLFAVLSFGMHYYRHVIYRIFTNEDEVIEGCELIWDKVVYYNFHVSVFGINLGIATGLGHQWMVGWLAIFFLWVIGLPALYYVAIVLEGGINAAWQTIWPCYAAMNIVLDISFLLTDWEEVAIKVRIRESSNMRLSHRNSFTISNEKKIILVQPQHHSHYKNDKESQNESFLHRNHNFNNVYGALNDYSLA